MSVNSMFSDSPNISHIVSHRAGQEFSIIKYQLEVESCHDDMIMSYGHMEYCLM